MKWIEGGVCAAKGFMAAGVSGGLKSPGKLDMAMVLSETDTAAAAVFTKNVVQAAPIGVSKAHLEDGSARAVIINSGNANACAPDGEKNAQAMCDLTAKTLGIPPEAVIVASTGVIGQTLTPQMPNIASGIEKLAEALTTDGSTQAAQAIMTTDTAVKECALETELCGVVVHIGGIAKGSGMIHPNMGTMLAFITTDVAVDAQLLQKALKTSVQRSFNRISVDGDTSTNDTCLVMAGGEAGNAPITEENAAYQAFEDALTELCKSLARAIAADGEGAGHLITCHVEGAATEESAETIGKAVVSSSLFKAAIFGADANWGRVLCAMGYAGEDFDPDKVTISFQSAAGTITVCENGRGLNFDEDLAKKILTEADVMVEIQMGEGAASCTCWGCDLTYEYVKINGDYRS